MHRSYYRLSACVNIEDATVPRASAPRVTSCLVTAEHVKAAGLEQPQEKELTHHRSVESFPTPGQALKAD